MLLTFVADFQKIRKMGLEAKTLIHTENLCFEINAYLESRELIIRGPLKLRIAFSEIENLHIDGDDLSFDFQNDNFRLELGKDVKKWHDKILAPPKSLFEKLGLKPNVSICAISNISSQTLRDTIENNLSPIESADFLFAEIMSEPELLNALKQNECRKPIWIANIKGKASPLGENTIREIMRSHSFKDNKTCAIDDVWSATRYHAVSN